MDYWEMESWHLVGASIGCSVFPFQTQTREMGGESFLGLGKRGLKHLFFHDFPGIIYEEKAAFAGREGRVCAACKVCFARGGGAGCV